MKKAGDILGTFFRLNDIQGGEEYVAFFRAWEQIVGTDLAAHCQITDIKNGAMVVEVDHPGWMQMLQMRKDEIVRKVRQRFPQLGVSMLHMRLVNEVSRAGTGMKKQERREQSTQDRAPGQNESPEELTPSKSEKEALERIADTGLRGTLERLRQDIRRRENSTDPDES